LDFFYLRSLQLGRPKVSQWTALAVYNSILPHREFAPKPSTPSFETQFPEDLAEAQSYDVDLKNTVAVAELHFLEQALIVPDEFS
jgi:hypothetical protein